MHKDRERAEKQRSHLYLHSQARNISVAVFNTVLVSFKNKNIFSTKNINELKNKNVFNQEKRICFYGMLGLQSKAKSIVAVS